MEGCSTIAWCPVSFWMVNVSGADRLKAHGSSDVCSELTQATHTRTPHHHHNLHTHRHHRLTHLTHHTEREVEVVVEVVGEVGECVVTVAVAMCL